MIVADIISFLGNQLFIYAATKSIALDLGYAYRYRVLKPTWTFGKNEEIKAIGHQYIYDFEKAFHIDTSERVGDLIQLENTWTWCRLSNTNFNEEAYAISDNTHLKGHFLSPKYFEHRYNEVLSWFKIREEYLEKEHNKLKQIKERSKVSQAVSLHMRYGSYRRDKLSLNPSYYRNAVEQMRRLLCARDLCFILFSDEPKEAKALLRMDDIIVSKGDLFEDLCLMTLCDGHIISNSTFAWWGAWLSNSKIVIRPSIWPIADGKLMPTDIFPSHWITVEAEREKLTPRIFFRYRVVNDYNRYTRTWITKPFVIFKKLVKKLLKVFQRAPGTIRK